MHQSLGDRILMPAVRTTHGGPRRVAAIRHGPQRRRHGSSPQNRAKYFVFRHGRVSAKPAASFALMTYASFSLKVHYLLRSHVHC